ncbi:MAG: carboxylesterase family protein [Saprospiraceae bacterium]|nr:carboxylesterase family protein [Saprospiraceae bacterium]
MKYFYSILILFSFALSVQGQNKASGCNGQRYIFDIFPNVTKTTVTYATNVNTLGQNQALKMDVYTPDGDTSTSRPVIIWAYGGSFITGKRSDMENYCITFAKKGYVTATIDYRLWPLLVKGFPTGEQILDVVVQAVSDMKGSVRYFRKDADQTNQFKIDPARIIVGGISAGAITALHAANLDDQDVLSPFIQNAVDNNGGINGNTGDSLMLTYPSNVLSVINLSGGLYDADWLDANSPPFVSYHGDADATVPYTSGIANGLLYIEGSKLLKDRSDAIGLSNYLVTVPGGGHTDIYTDAKFGTYLAEFSLNTVLFMEDLLCGATSTKEPVVTNEIIAKPNPAKYDVNLEMPDQSSYNVQIINAMGQTTKTYEVLNTNQLTINRDGVSNGMYFIKIEDKTNNKHYISRVVFY